MGMLPEGAVVNHFLTDTDAFFIKTDAPNGFKYFNRSPIKTAMEGDFDTGNMRFKARERYSFGVSDWRCAQKRLISAVLVVGLRQVNYQK